jgi:hypothetical protein
MRSSPFVLALSQRSITAVSRRRDRIGVAYLDEPIRKLLRTRAIGMPASYQPSAFWRRKRWSSSDREFLLKDVPLLGLSFWTLADAMRAAGLSRGLSAADLDRFDHQ